jgi:hypothetical protein
MFNEIKLPDGSAVFEEMIAAYNLCGDYFFNLIKRISKEGPLY